MEQEQAVMTVAEFIKAKNITMTTQRIARRSDSITAWDKDARHGIRMHGIGAALSGSATVRV